MIARVLTGAMLLAGMVMWLRLIVQTRRAIIADRGHCSIPLAATLAWFAMWLMPSTAFDVILGRKPPMALVEEGSQ